MKKIVIATNNKGKLAEFKEILKNDFMVLSLNEIGINIEVEETGVTFLENALLKAQAVYRLCGELTLADDSGLCVNALNGAPGVYSARFSGETASSLENIELLLQKMKNAKDRSAYFACSLALYMGEEKYLSGYGETKGQILSVPEGREGFGYDPIFYSNELNKSFAVASSTEKNSVSHRSRALVDLLQKLNLDSLI